MNDSAVHSGVIHFGDKAVRSELEIAKIRRIELLRAVLAVDRPYDPALLPVDAEVHVRQAIPFFQVLRRQGTG